MCILLYYWANEMMMIFTETTTVLKIQVSTAARPTPSSNGVQCHVVSVRKKLNSERICCYYYYGPFALRTDAWLHAQCGRPFTVLFNLIFNDLNGFIFL